MLKALAIWAPAAERFLYSTGYRAIWAKHKAAIFWSREDAEFFLRMFRSEHPGTEIVEVRLFPVLEK